MLGSIAGTRDSLQQRHRVLSSSLHRPVAGCTIVLFDEGCALQEGAAMVSVDHFRQGLQTQMGPAAKSGLIDVLINSGELYRSLGGYPGSVHGMPSCCEAMQAEMKAGDVLLVERCNGAGMTVRYLLPRRAN
jgi:hypothetical protein